MPEIAEPLKSARILSKPKKFPPLREFSCGRQGRRWEKLVNEWARGVYLGTQAHAETVVVIEDAHGKLIGASGFRALPLPGYEAGERRLGKLLGHAQYIQMLGVDRRYHGHRRPDGSRLGDLLLRGTLELIEHLHEDRAPVVWAQIAPENARARSLFARHGFIELAYAGEGDVPYARSKHASALASSGGGRLLRLAKRLRSANAPGVRGEATRPRRE